VGDFIGSPMFFVVMGLLLVALIGVFVYLRMKPPSE
jgi:hypothetical protein